MACLPRFLRHRSKNSFNPRVDENPDPIVNNADNPVQIGRYIRREEKPVFSPILTPSPSEARLYKTPTIASTLSATATRTTTIGATPLASPAPTLTENASSPLTVTKIETDVHKFDNNQPNQQKAAHITKKKFISNKDKILSRDSNNNSSTSSSAAESTDVSGHAINVTRSNSKLKPVKARRPTALPSEAPQLEDERLDSDVEMTQEAQDVQHAVQVEDTLSQSAGKWSQLQVLVNGDNVGDSGNGSSIIAQNNCTGTPTTRMPTPNSTSLLIPGQTPTQTTSAPATPSAHKEHVKFFIGNNVEEHRHGHGHKHKHGHRPGRGQWHKDDDDDDEVDGDADDLHYPTTKAHVNALTLLPKPPANGYLKSYSHASLNYMNGSQQNARSVSVNRPKFSRSVSSTNDIYIPPPPPMPTEPLVPSPALRKPTVKEKLATEVAADVEAEVEEDMEEATVSKATNGTAGTSESASKNSSTTSSAESARTLASGKSKDTQTPTPKASDESAGTPKSHRVEGGLIFVRPNLPSKTNIEIVYIEKDDATRNLIHTAIERNDFLNNLMDKERKEMVIKAMAPANYDKDSYIILEKEEGSEIFVSAEGYYDVIKDGKHVGNFGPATVFGELAILYNAPRQATIKAATNARVWKIARKTFRAIMQISGSREREENLNFMRSAPFLKDLSASVLDKVVDLLQRKFYETNSCIVREGELGNEFFIIRGGTVTIKKRDEQGTELVVNRRRRGDYFGEQALLNADRRQASVYADPPGTEVLKLDRKTFISYLGTIPLLREKPTGIQTEQSRANNKNAEFDNEYANIPISELKKIATLGSGAFGRVDLVTHGQKTFALKIIKKIEIVKADQIEHVYNEKNVMIKCRSSPFIVELYRTYRNEKFVYFLMEVCMGGDVWTVMSRRQHFDDKTATFIAACVVEAFDFLHSHNFVYRDLKPENLMLTTDGYCKLGDFGFAKHVRPHEKTNTFAGTPEYVAPEIILDRGHDRAVDYWALGILIFELLVGKTPFRGYNQIKIYQQILSGIDVIHMPSRIPKSAQGLIKHLCKQLPAERLGYQRRGIQDIKRHSWFDSIDWAKLKTKQFVSPIKRPINSSTDLQYFERSVIENDYEPPDELSGWDRDF